MKEDVYGPQLKELLQTSTEPLSPREMIEAVGCSPQRVYAWVKNNRANLRAMGKTSKGGVQYTWREGAGTELTIARKTRGTRRDSDAGIEVGAQLTVTRLALVNGEVVVELTGPAGEQFHAVPA